MIKDQIKNNLECKLLDDERKLKERELLLKKMEEDHLRDLQEMKLHQLKKQTFLVSIFNLKFINSLCVCQILSNCRINYSDSFVYIINFYFFQIFTKRT